MERYIRNILIDEVGKEGQKKLSESRILVAGAGGLGSTVIANLASVGIGTLGIIDYDSLELSNLNRQYIHKPHNIGKNKAISAKEWVQEYNPDINVEVFPFKLENNTESRDLIKCYDLVIDCFDTYRSKFLLNEICVKQAKIFIHGGITEFFGQVMTIIPYESACLNCMIPEYDPNMYDVKGVISPAVSTVASIQAMEAVKVVLKTGEILKSELLTYDGLKQDFRKIKMQKNTKCPLCSKSD